MISTISSIQHNYCYISTQNRFFFLVVIKKRPVRNTFRLVANKLDLDLFGASEADLIFSLGLVAARKEDMFSLGIENSINNRYYEGKGGIPAGNGSQH